MVQDVGKRGAERKSTGRMGVDIRCIEYRGVGRRGVGKWGTGEL